MSTETPIYFSRTGKAEHKELYAGCAAPSKEELRRWAIELWYDLRQRQREDGYRPSAAVWIGQTRCQPTVTEIEAHEQKLREILEREGKHKESEGAEDELPDVADDNEQQVETSSSGISHEEPSEDESELPDLVLDDDDDLDF
jgi:hypothetical protein